MLKHNLIFKKQFNLLTNLLNLVIILVSLSFTDLFSQAVATAPIEITVQDGSPEQATAKRFAMEVTNQINTYFINEYRPDMTKEEVLIQVENSLDVLISGLDGLLESLRDHSGKLAANDPETKKLYQNIANIIHAHLNLTKINNQDQAVVVAKTTNLIYEQIEKFLLAKPVFDLQALKTDLDLYSANIYRDISVAKKRGDSDKEIRKLQSELDVIKQATNNLAKINKPLELIKWVQTSKYDPRAIFLRWYLGVQLAKTNSYRARPRFKAIY